MLGAFARTLFRRTLWERLSTTVRCFPASSALYIFVLITLALLHSATSCMRHPILRDRPRKWVSAVLLWFFLPSRYDRLQKPTFAAAHTLLR